MPSTGGHSHAGPGGQRPSCRTAENITGAHTRGARLVSICTGAFVLTAAGLLDGRPATTHWRQAEQLRRRYPLLNVLPNQLYVDDGDILTSAGVTAGIDLCLHLIRTDLGAAAANTRARDLVAPPRRQGSQAQFIEQFRPWPTATSSPCCGSGCSTTSQTPSPSTTSRNGPICHGGPSSAASARRPPPRRWPG
uniref:DJ-1/PfpI family protein n=1 Tax=Streptomyces sp. NBC_01562 TaxID=2975879 RepID=UPI003BAA4BF3